MTPGQAAYEAWRHLIIPPVTLSWDALPSNEARDGWEKVADAACTETALARILHDHRGWRDAWEMAGRDQDGNLELRHIKTGGVYRLLPIEEL